MITPPAPPQQLHRVLMTADTVGGVWTYAMDLCRGLQGYGVEVVLLSMGRMPDAEQSRQASELSNLRLIPTEYRLEWMTGCEADLERSGEFLLALEQQVRPDVIHLNTYWHAQLPLRAPRLVVAHSCVASWWAACRGTDLPEEWARYVSWVRHAVRAADILVAPSAAFLREFQRLHGIPARWRLIRNGRDASLFRTGPKRNLVLSAGRLWDEAKNVLALCEATQGLEIPVVVAGETLGPNGETAPSSSVLHLGKVAPAELAAWMSTATIFVAPARYEPFGLTILEAALSGCALVLGDIPSLRELWDGVAIFVDPRDTSALRSVLSRLSENPQLMVELGARASARAAHYSLTRMVRSYHQTYCSLLGSNLEAVA